MALGTLTIAGVNYTIPPLSLKNLRGEGLDLLRKTDKIVKSNDDTFASMELRGKLIHLALKQVAPDVPEDQLFDVLNMANIVPIWLHVLGTSGLNNTGEDQPEKAPATLTPGT